MGWRTGRGKVSGRAPRGAQGQLSLPLPTAQVSGLAGGSGGRSLQSRTLHARYILSFLCCSPATRHKMCSESDISRSADSAASCPSARTVREGRTRRGRCTGLPGQGEPAGPYTASPPGPGPAVRPPHSAPGRALGHSTPRKTALHTIATLAAGEGFSADLFEIRPLTKWKLNGVLLLLTQLQQFDFVL